MCNLSENIYEKGKEDMLRQIIQSKIRSNASDETIYNEFKEFGVSMKIIKIIRNRMSHSL